MKKIFLLRHGQTQGIERFLGQKDIALSPRGWQEMKVALKDHTFDFITTSPLSRCLSFAEEWAQKHGLEVFVDERFAEWQAGDWTGQLKKAIDPVKYHKWHQDPNLYTPPKAEKMRDFHHRVYQAWLDLVALVEAEAYAQTLVITHGGVIRSLWGQLLHIPAKYRFRQQIPHAFLLEVALVDIDGDYYQITPLGRPT